MGCSSNPEKHGLGGCTFLLSQPRPLEALKSLQRTRRRPRMHARFLIFEFLRHRVSAPSDIYPWRYWEGLEIPTKHRSWALRSITLQQCILFPSRPGVVAHFQPLDLSSRDIDFPFSSLLTPLRAYVPRTARPPTLSTPHLIFERLQNTIWKGGHVGRSHFTRCLHHSAPTPAH